MCLYVLVVTSTGEQIIFNSLKIAMEFIANTHDTLTPVRDQDL